MKKNRKVRLFIVGPTEAGKANGDFLYVVCETTSRESFLHIYMDDLFVDVGATDSAGSKADAIAYCKRHGYKRPYILE